MEPTWHLLVTYMSLTCHPHVNGLQLLDLGVTGLQLLDLGFLALELLAHLEFVEGVASERLEVAGGDLGRGEK